jgi:hypothetical protein
VSGRVENSATAFVILTSKAGIFHTEPGPDLEVLETYDYLFHGACKARFSIASLSRATHVVIIDEREPPASNRVPSKMLPTFPSLDAARRDLQQLVGFDRPHISLVRVER